VAGALGKHGDELCVAADGTAPFRSIQAALEAAPEGATVRITAGVYAEHLAITKPVTLVGDGWATTRVTLPYERVVLDPATLRAQSEAIAAAATDDQRDALTETFRRARIPRPVVQIDGVAGVTLRGLAFAMPGESREGVVEPGAILMTQAARVVIEDCALLGSPASGATITGASDVTLRRSLVGGADATGIAISGPEPKVLVSECEVRNCHHRGITVRGNAGTTIERCRISGSAWHGIRYDDSAPKVLGNTIHGNARSGIYASGETHAEVRGNLFLRNGMTGMSCWYQNQDRIEGNTFVADARSGLEVLGGSRPTVTRNLFHDLKQAIALGAVSGDGPGTKSTGVLDLRENVFSRVVVRVAGLPQQEGAADPSGTGGNRAEDIVFLGDGFALPAASPLRDTGVGAAEPLALASPWPLQPEERKEEQRRTAEARSHEFEAEARAAQVVSRSWVADLHQLRDRAKRDAAVAEVRAALASPDRGLRYAALLALNQAHDVEFDRSPLREVVADLCRSEAGDAQVCALYCLHRIGVRDEDRGFLLAALRAPSPPLAQSGTHLLMSFFDRRIEGPAADAALLLLRSAESSNVRSALTGLWGATASDEVQSRMLELERDATTRHDAIYFGLSTLQNKSRAVVERLVEALADPDHNNSGRALWGLGQGVSDGESKLVADAALALFEGRGAQSSRTDALRLLARHGGPVHAAGLRELLAIGLLQGALAHQVEDTIRAIEAR